MTEIATRSADADPHGPAAGTLALRADQRQWTDQQRAGLAQLGVANAPAGDLAVFLHVAQRTGLDPFSRQIYMIGRGGKWTIQTGIDGLRVIASRHPAYSGQIGPQWCGDDGVWRDFWHGKTPPVAARVGILRRDWAEPVWGVALHAEFNAGNPMWRDKPAHMLAKVAEALALRKAFPHDLAGLVSADETARDDHRAVVVQHVAPVTAAELTGAPPPVRDWHAEITTAATAGDTDTLRQLWYDAKDHPEVREWITAAFKSLPQPDLRNDDEDRTDDHQQADEDNPR